MAYMKKQKAVGVKTGSPMASQPRVAGMGAVVGGTKANPSMANKKRVADMQKAKAIGQYKAGRSSAQRLSPAGASGVAPVGTAPREAIRKAMPAPTAPTTQPRTTGYYQMSQEELQKRLGSKPRVTNRKRRP